MRHLRVVLVDVEFDHRTNTRHRVQRVQEQPSCARRPPAHSCAHLRHPQDH
jgi:hypothetical protein